MSGVQVMKIFKNGQIHSFLFFERYKTFHQHQSNLGDSFVVSDIKFIMKSFGSG